MKGLWRYDTNRTGHFVRSKGGTPKSLRWKLFVQRGMMGSPIVTKDTLFIYSHASKEQRNGTLFLVNLLRRSIQGWRPKADYEPAIADNKLVACVRRGSRSMLVCYDLSRQSEVWRNEELFGVVYSPLIDDNRVFLADSNSVKLLRLFDGALLWSSITGGVPFGIAKSAGFVVANSFRAGLFAYDADTGRLRWHNPLEEDGLSLSTPCIYDSKVFIVIKRSTAPSGFVAAYDLGNGRLVWKEEVRDAGDASPACDGRRVYIVGLRGIVSCLSASDGKICWTTRIKAGSSCSPSIAGSYLYLGDSSGWLYAIDTNQGKIVWHYRTGGMITGSPWVWQNQVLFASTDGYIYCFDYTK